VSAFQEQVRHTEAGSGTGSARTDARRAWSTLNGKRSVVVSVNGQINEKSPQPMLAAFRRLRQIEENAVCAALR